jgi:hypothetical protein
MILGLLRRQFDATSWDVWRVFLKALEALPMDEAEMALYRHHTGHTEPPTKPARYAELVSAAAAESPISSRRLPHTAIACRTIATTSSQAKRR